MARYEAMHLIRYQLGYSLPLIGRVMHRDHTTVLYGLRRHAGAGPGKRNRKVTTL